MRFVVDRFEAGYAILENMENKKIKEGLRFCLPYSIQEGSILTFNGYEYVLEDEMIRQRKKEILDRFERLKNNTSD